MAGEPPRIVAVLTDGGYILYDDMPGKLAAWRTFLPHVSLSYAEFETRFRAFKDRAQTDPSYRLGDAVAGLAKALGLPDGAVEARERPRPVPREATVPTLALLKAHGIPVVVVSDSMDSREALRVKYHDVLGLGGLLTDIVSSLDVGVQKPHPAIWEAALRALAKHGVDASDRRTVAFVGHDPAELEGAHAFGFRVFACHYDDGPELPFVPPEDRLRTLAELPARLGIVGVDR